MVGTWEGFFWVSSIKWILPFIRQSLLPLSIPVGLGARGRQHLIISKFFSIQDQDVKIYDFIFSYNIFKSNIILPSLIYKK